MLPQSDFQICVSVAQAEDRRALLKVAIETSKIPAVCVRRHRPRIGRQKTTRLPQAPTPAPITIAFLLLCNTNGLGLGHSTCPTTESDSGATVVSARLII